MPPQRNRDLHGSAPDSCPVALLLIDLISDFEFEGAQPVLRAAEAIAPPVAALAQRARAARVPVVYVNDNFGRWRSDFRALLSHCLEDGVAGEAIARRLSPQAHDYFVLKPKHSGFLHTTLEPLLAYLGARKLVLTGIAANSCVLFTANDAYMREMALCVPRDCVAAATAAEHAYALEHLQRVLKADTRPGAEIDFAALCRVRD